MRNVTGRHVLGASLVAGGILLALIGGLLGMLARNIAGTHAEAAMVALVVGVVLVAAGMKAYRWGKRIYRSAAPLRDDPRPPVLYLRSFDSDKRGRKVGLHVPTVLPTNFHTEAEQLALPFQALGPLELVRPPKSVLPDLPGKGVALDDATWQHEVDARIQRARLVLLRAGASEGLLWEVETCLSRLTPERLIIVVPGYRGTREYESFMELFRDRFPRPLPEYAHGWRDPAWVGALIWFMPDWEPRLEKVRESTFNLGVPLARGVETALRPYREQYGIQTHAPAAALLPRILAGCVDVAVLASLFMIGYAVDHLAAFVFFGIVCCILYFPAFEVSPLRGTPGKRLMGLWMVGHGGLPISMMQSMMRLAAKFFSVITVVPAVVSLAALLRGRRTVHDALTGTFVEQRPAPAELPAAAVPDTSVVRPALG